MDTKRCTKCGEVKPLTEFTKDKSKRDGHSPRCKVCTANRKKAYRAAHPEKDSAYGAAWRAANKEKIRAYGEVYRAANKEKILAYGAARYVAQRGKRLAQKAAERARITPGYAANSLGIPTSDLTPELYEAYREYLLTKRATKALTEALKGKTNVE